jgi:hypothetical protein
MKTQKTVLYIMIIGIICIIVTPYLFTRFGWGIDLTSTNTNNIGGTIGGITAPFTGVLGSLLVYFALKEQVLANKLIQKQLDEQKQSDEESKVVTYLKQQLDIIIRDIEGFSYLHTEKQAVKDGEIEVTRVISGSSAIDKYLVLCTLNPRKHGAPNILEDVYQLGQLKNLISFINEFTSSTLTEDISEKDRAYLLSLIKYLYTTKIKLHFDFYELNFKADNLSQCEICQEYHKGIPVELYDVVDSINKNLNL